MITRVRRLPGSQGHPVHGEVRVLTMVSQETIGKIADRIEFSYCLRNPGYVTARASHGVWEAAASGLLTLQRNFPGLPLDPEMFVASQPVNAWCDPWGELTQPCSFARYRRQVRKIVEQLRGELKSEIRFAARQVGCGRDLMVVFAEAGARMSPLGRYVVACQRGNVELAERLRPGAERQHRTCPLYKEACRSFLPCDLYPSPRTFDLLPELVIPAGIELPCFSMN